MHPTTIGPYQIIRELGHGGMGEVHLATDSRLDRHVAIKAIPAHLAEDPDRLARFQREAKVLASLSHPGIGAIHGLEESGGRQYLILEYIEGETLAERLIRGPIPIDEALALARQIAEALEAAHDKGVIHRDLKPGNIMVTPEGAAKVLDFGLARTGEGPSSSTNAARAAAIADSPTITAPVRHHSPTVPGVIMGTAGYMSPEQARGKPVDRRSDIFSFGCVLFEMLSGEQPFGGETATDALGAILHREPDWKQLPPSTPARVRELLTNCLAKERRNRLHDIGDARLELDRAIGGREWLHAGAGASPRKLPLRLAWAAPVVAGLLGVGWLAGRATQRPEPSRVAQSFHVSASVPSKPDLGSVQGIAPDARFVVYKAWPDKVADATSAPGALAVRRLDRNETKVIEGTEGVDQAAVSPDGRWIAFTAARDGARTKVVLKKIALEDGRPTGNAETLCDLPAGGWFSICWSSDREIILAATWVQTILAVPASGGEPRVVLKEEQSKEVDNWGEVRPLVPGKSILATRWALVGQTIRERTEVVDLATGARTPLLQNAGGTQLVEGGYIVARRNLNTLIAARFDPETLRLIGEPVTVWSGNFRESFFVSRSGTLALISGASDYSQRKLMWIDEQGQSQPVGAPARPYGQIMISPDGSRVATNLESADQSELPTDVWVYDLSRRTFSRMSTQGPAWVFIWSRDGQRISHISVNKEEFSVWDRRADGSGEGVKVYASPGTQFMVFPTDRSPDGKVLAVTQVDLSKSTSDVLMLEQEDGSTKWTATPYLNSPAGEDALRFSADGKWVRFNSSESGRNELYVQRFSGAAMGAEDARKGRWQVSTDGATGTGWWSPDGKELRYVNLDSQVMSVHLQMEPGFSASTPKVLASFKDLKLRDSTFAPDGRLMVVLQGENEQPSRIDLVVNFLDEVRAKVSTAK